MRENMDKNVSVIEKETRRRIDIYYNYAPGKPECQVQPFTFKQVRHSLYLSLILVGLFVWGAVAIFPAYFHS